MYLSPRVLGAHAVHTLTTRAAAPVLTIGSDHFRRGDLSGIGCFNFIAAQHLTAAIKAIGGVKHARDLFEHVPPDALVLPGVGAISLSVLGAAFEAKGIGGDAPLESWYTKHRGKEAHEFVTFDTLKAHERSREPGERRAIKHRADRHHARRDRAQRIRGDRHLARHT